MSTALFDHDVSGGYTLMIDGRLAEYDVPEAGLRDALRRARFDGVDRNVTVNDEDGRRQTLIEFERSR